MEDQRQFVHERDIEVSLSVLDDLRGLGHFNAGGPMDPGFHHGRIGLRDDSSDSSS